MKKNLSFIQSLFAVLAIISVGASAGTVAIGPTKIEAITIVGNTSFGHQAGNLEIRVAGGTGGPVGVTCDQNYITTKNTSPNFNQILSVLLTVQAADKWVILGISDDPALTAFTGRCSIVFVTLVN